MAVLKTKDGEKLDFIEVYITDTSLYLGYTEEDDLPRVFPEANVKEVVPEREITRETESIDERVGNNPKGEPIVSERMLIEYVIR